MVYRFQYIIYIISGQIHTTAHTTLLMHIFLIFTKFIKTLINENVISIHYLKWHSVIVLNDTPTDSSTHNFRCFVVFYLMFAAFKQKNCMVFVTLLLLTTTHIRWEMSNQCAHSLCYVNCHRKQLKATQIAQYLFDIYLLLTVHKQTKYDEEENKPKRTHINR